MGSHCHFHHQQLLQAVATFFERCQTVLLFAALPVCGGHIKWFMYTSTLAMPCSHHNAWHTTGLPFSMWCSCILISFDNMLQLPAGSSAVVILCDSSSLVANVASQPKVLSEMADMPSPSMSQRTWTTPPVKQTDYPARYCCLMWCALTSLQRIPMAHTTVIPCGCMCCAAATYASAGSASA